MGRKKVKAVQVRSDPDDYANDLYKFYAHLDCRDSRCEREKVKGALADAAKHVEGKGIAVEKDEVLRVLQKTTTTKRLDRAALCL